ncbi:non-ribosomal peptide synthetase [Pleurocapsa sp. CCALA 161]|uniref:non-ribosomal peptide synthetase n=1 Tax=Pleurocapsa sp. CCALA 161 TaxID=2107688 RepID=UPI000D05E892|nr:non-ribosomal peptide synthetase [Pleurocapsa sp. CCALA 161]PSB11065.1 non-ribosomal peptide synthetase [Pleurocapsa sp. CCALA 161]
MLTEIKEGFRLSLQQEYLWSLHKDNDSQNYRVQCAILIEGNLNIQVLKMALENIVNRYEILRTNFRYLPGISIPVQAIADDLDGLTLLEKFYDLRDLTPQAQEQEIENVLATTKNLPLDFEQESIFNTCLVTLSKQRHLLIINTSAMLVDLSSIRNLIRELSRSYSACLQGESISEQPLQYVDFAEWQNEILAAAETEIGREYWSKQDFSTLGHLKLPRESHLRHKLEFSPRLFTTKITKNTAKKIRKTALDYDTSVANFLLACWQTLLWRLTKQENIIIGIACAGREYPELKDTIGLFAKNLPLHNHLNDHLSFSQIVQNIEESLAEISRWQECFDWQEIIDNTQQFNFCLIGFDFESEAIKYCEDNLSFSLYQQFTCTDKFEVKLSCRPQDNSVVTDFYYDSAQFTLEDIKRLQDQFYLLVESAVENPEAKIDTLNILSDRARNQLLVEFNQTQADYPTDKCIHHLFEEQVRSTPDNVAVVFDDQQLTYKDLNQRANQLAHYLQKLGLQPGTLVGICVERSLLMLVGILGIIKAGGAYVPIDPTYPQARITWILENSQTPFLLTQQLLLETLSQHQQVPKICLDTDWETIANHNQENLALDLIPNNLAYIIYTSGSTGKPKGVRINHRNLVHSTCARISYYQQPVTRFLLLSSFAFDSSVAGIFWTICQGGTLYLPEADLPRDIPKLIESIDRDHISHLLCLPSLYALTLQESKPQALQSLQTVIVAGESCTQELVKRHLAKLPETNLFNEYGPTENTVWSSVYHCQSEIPGRIPIGKPIANVEIYILDSLLNPVPIQVPGEIYLGGTGIAQGYLDQPQLTAEKFIPHPFSQDLDARLYKTGDLGQYLADGNIEFLGRSDRQVKIRGYRIELEEIELTLNQHPDLQESVVVVREEQTNYQSLVAYGVPHQESAPSIEELRYFLQEKLPNYMIPSVFVLLDNLPLTPNGKIDRQSLPRPEQVRSHNSGIFVAPRTPIEEILVEIWRDLLKVEQISIYDNFFDLGGHSLLTTQLLAKIRETLQIDISLRSLLETPRIDSLAQNIARVIHPENNDSTQPQTLIDFKTEAMLDPTIQLTSHPENPGAVVTDGTCILLTGATGFLGAFLLYELLQQTEAEIYCLVRCSNFEAGKQKLRDSLESYYLWDESLSSRIIPLPGDLSKPLLGLEATQFQEIASKIDAIYHNGAWVHHIYPYSILKATNVLGTQEVLRLASQIKVKPVHFISSSSVFSSQAHSGVKLIREQDELNDRLIPEDGYSQTKWVAEKLVTIAGERGIPVSIYRPSRISGHSQTGVFNQNDFLSKLILGCIQLEAAPDEDIKENIVPVDYVSKAIVRLSSKKTSLGKAFHLVNSQTLHSNMLIEQIRSLGYSLKTIDYQQWRSQLLQITKGSAQHPLYSLIPFFPAQETAEKIPTASLEFDCQNTLYGLEGSSIICPPVDQKLLHKYCSYLIQQEIKS